MCICSPRKQRLRAVTMCQQHLRRKLKPGRHWVREQKSPVEQTGRKLGMVHGGAYQAKRADFASPQAHSGSLETNPEREMSVISHEHMLFMSLFLQTCLHVVNPLPRTSHHDEWLFLRAISSENRNRHVGSYHQNQTTPGTVFQTPLDYRRYPCIRTCANCAGCLWAPS